VEKSSGQRKAAPSKTAPRVALLLVIFGAFAIICFGLIYYVGDLSKYQEVISAKETQAILRDVNDPGQLDQALRQFPSNGTLKLLALANRHSIELDAAIQKRLNAVEPTTLPKPAGLTASKRGDLDAVLRDLKIAASNAAAFQATATAMIKTERDKAEKEARSLKAGGEVTSRFMAMIDEQDQEMAALTSKVSAARVEYYGAYQKCVELLVRESGTYRIEGGQFVFPFQHSADSYNRAATAMDAAAKRVSELEDGKAAMRQSQFGKWKAFADR
jgi:hypothetical protein